MQVRYPLAVGLALGLASLVRCGGAKKPAEVAPPAPVEGRPNASEAGAEGGAAGETGDRAERPRRPDPALVKKALDQTGADSPDATQAHGLRFEVVENGPNGSWAMAVVNRGSETLRVTFDPRLLSLEIEPPPPKPDAKRRAPKTKPKPRLCRAPAEVRPAGVDPRMNVVLEPGHGYVEAFDPHFYCISGTLASPLVAGARVRARLGFAPKTKTVYKGGKHDEVLPEQKPPFVAIAVPAPEVADGGTAPGVADAGASADSPDAGGDAEDVKAAERAEALEAEITSDQGVKELHGTAFELGSDYAPPPEPEKVPSLRLVLISGSDAATPSDATVTLSLSNQGATPERVYFRRELVSFEVSGLDGSVVCDPEPDDRVPDRQAFTLLNPGQSIAATSRLIELCPQDSFARPGVYLVRGEFDALARGGEYGLNAFVGHLAADEPVTIRVRSGNLPYPGERALEAVRVGAP